MNSDVSYYINPDAIENGSITFEKLNASTLTFNKGDASGSVVQIIDLDKNINKATGKYAIALGLGTNAKNEGEFACGKYNNSGEYTIFSVGNGSEDDKRNNVFEIQYSDSPRILIYGDVSIVGNLNTTGTQTITEINTNNVNELYVKGETQLVGNTIIDGTTTINNNFSVTGNSSLNDVNINNLNVSEIIVDNIYVGEKDDDNLVIGKKIYRLEYISAVKMSNESPCNISYISHKYDAINKSGVFIYDKAPTYIKTGAFESSFVESIILPDSITTINNRAFYKCESLKHITFSKNLKKIAESAFTGCLLLNDVNIPIGTIEIGKWSFSSCNSLTNIIIPNTVTLIGDQAFNNCTLLNNIIIPDSVNTIGDYAFDGCSSLNNIIIGSAVASIGASAFVNCYKLAQVIIKSYPPIISDNIFPSATPSIIVSSDKLSIYKNNTNWCIYDNKIIGSNILSLNYDSLLQLLINLESRLSIVESAFMIYE